MPLCHLLGHSGDVSQRLFLALWLPPDVASQVAAELPLELSDLRWQPANRWHITLAFLGRRSPDKELRRLDALRVMSAQPIRLQGSGTFGQVLWLGVIADDWLPELARRCAELFDTEDRRFRAHVTVARARSMRARSQLDQAGAGLAGFTSSPWLPMELTLVSSRTGPQPSYEVIGRRPLVAT